MSLLRQVPEFVRGIELAIGGKWSRALLDFSRTSEILIHANRPRDSAIASLYAATCQYYSGDTLPAHRAFVNIYQRGMVDPLTTIAARAAISTQPVNEEKHFAIPNSTDRWVQLCASNEPVISDRVTLGSNSTALEENAACNALIYLATKRISDLPPANLEGRSVEDEMDIINQALKAGETLAKRPSAEFTIIAKWYIGRALMLRGRLFEFNGNALMAEGMYNAALEQATKNFIATPRLVMLKALSTKSLGELLMKWEKREAEGKSLKEATAWLTPQLETLISHRVILEPTLEELAILENNSYHRFRPNTVTVSMRMHF